MSKQDAVAKRPHATPVLSGAGRPEDANRSFSHKDMVLSIPSPVSDEGFVSPALQDEMHDQCVQHLEPIVFPFEGPSCSFRIVLNNQIESTQYVQDVERFPIVTSETVDDYLTRLIDLYLADFDVQSMIVLDKNMNIVRNNQQVGHDMVHLVTLSVMASTQTRDEFEDRNVLDAIHKLQDHLSPWSQNLLTRSQKR